ncbi:MAG: hypothetical protein KDN22_22515 [Verrucomicrobiae bacterium]|nr:hypothetical protein [Verrucomicrobiae bacterium]
MTISAGADAVAKIAAIANTHPWCCLNRAEKQGEGGGEMGIICGFNLPCGLILKIGSKRFHEAVSPGFSSVFKLILLSIGQRDGRCSSDGQD